MLEYSTVHWITFLTAAILLNLSPGPDLLYIVSQTSKKGVSSGFAALFGVWSGTFIHIIFAALGLSAILMTSAMTFSVVKWAGAAYLIWIGIQSIRSKGLSFETNHQSDSRSLSKTYSKGVFVSLLNPKVAIFFLAFLPQFVEPQLGAVGLQLFVHGVLIIVVASFIEIPIIFISSKLITYLQQNSKASIWMDRGLGALFIWIGIKLAASQQ